MLQIISIATASPKTPRGLRPTTIAAKRFSPKLAKSPVSTSDQEESNGKVIVGRRACCVVWSRSKIVRGSGFAAIHYRKTPMRIWTRTAGLLFLAVSSVYPTSVIRAATESPAKSGTDSAGNVRLLADAAPAPAPAAAPSTQPATQPAAQPA